MAIYRSHTVTHGRNMAGARALFRAAGVDGADLGRKPIIAVANSFTEFVPGHTHLAPVGRIVSDAIKEAEVNVSLVKPDYIIDGTIDLIRGSDDTVEIVDFKTSKKPDINSEGELLERYRRQLHVYAHLVEQRTGEKVSKMHLYYTGEDDGIPTITFPYTKTSVGATIDVFDDVVHRILNKQYDTRAKKQKTCDECDFHFYCGMARN